MILVDMWPPSVLPGPWASLVMAPDAPLRRLKGAARSCLFRVLAVLLLVNFDSLSV